MIVKNRVPLKFVVLIFFIVVIFLWASGLFLNGKTTTETPRVNVTSAQNDSNLNLLQIIHENKDEIYQINPSIFVTKWDLNSTNNDITLYVINIRNESEIKGLQGRKKGNYTILIVHDTEFEKNMADVQQQLIQLRKNPNYHIAAMPMTLDTFNDPPQNYIELLVDEITPENEKLNNTVIQGWKIFIRKITPMPVQQTLKPDSSYPSAK